MKICYANPTIVLKRPVAALAERMAQNHQVSLLTPRPLNKMRDCSAYYSDLKKVLVLDYSSLSLPLTSDWPIPLFGFYKQAWGAFRDNDVVHAWVPYYKSTLWLAILKLFFFRKKRFVLTMDTIPGYSFSMGGFMDLLFRIYSHSIGQIVYSSADAITLYGESFREHAIRAGIPKDKIRITPTGISQHSFSKKNVRKELGISKENKIVLFVGLLVPRKGIDTILKIAEHFQDKEVTFVIVGDGPKREAYERFAKDNSLNVIFVGPRQDVHSFYSSADIFLFPSRGEGIAGVLLEAMLHKVPVVASDIVGNRDVLGRKAGILCPTENVGKFVDAINELSKSASARKKYADSGLRRVRADFSWNGRFKAFEEVLS